MLQCGAVWCSLVQCIAVYCRVLQCVAACCSMLQCVAVWCSVEGPYWRAVQYPPVMEGPWEIESLKSELK